jgi:acyl-coenzyme A synthetase/AMP-(fatty) acid ligase
MKTRFIVRYLNKNSKKLLQKLPAITEKQRGLTKGDRVAGYLPNIPETVLFMLAANKHRRGLVLVFPGFWGTGCGGPIWANRTQSFDHHRRLLL